MNKGEFVPVVLKATNVTDKGNYQFEVVGSAVPEKGMLPVYVRLSEDAAKSAKRMFEKGPDMVLTPAPAPMPAPEPVAVEPVPVVEPAPAVVEPLTL